MKSVVLHFSLLPSRDHSLPNVDSRRLATLSAACSPHNRTSVCVRAGERARELANYEASRQPCGGSRGWTERWSEHCGGRTASAAEQAVPGSRCTVSPGRPFPGGCDYVKRRSREVAPQRWLCPLGRGCSSLFPSGHPHRAWKADKFLSFPPNPPKCCHGSDSQAGERSHIDSAVVCQLLPKQVGGTRSSC